MDEMLPVRSSSSSSSSFLSPSMVVGVETNEIHKGCRSDLLNYKTRFSAGILSSDAQKKIVDKYSLPRIAQMLQEHFQIDAAKQSFLSQLSERLKSENVSKEELIPEEESLEPAGDGATGMIDKADEEVVDNNIQSQPVSASQSSQASVETLIPSSIPGSEPRKKSSREEPSESSQLSDNTEPPATPVVRRSLRRKRQIADSDSSTLEEIDSQDWELSIPKRLAGKKRKPLIDPESPGEQVDGSDIPEPKRSRTRNKENSNDPATPRSAKCRWTKEEEKTLRRGVDEFGAGKWKQIWSKYFRKGRRSQVDLKDKWRNLQKAGKV
eukprot:TRINITY_DN3944_c1_g1_i1.p1 TRINITY_DN3944_c1_g1~~TRINITY_DN3944_c1_g1_i1.p1  ORF type:complete len:324 (+),score=87.97 TRINITY_DN3944_c1_g1_i1:170-1141(+)